MKDRAQKHILAIKPYQPGKPIDEVKRELGLKEVIKMASNECPYGPAPSVLRVIIREAKDVNRYPDGNCFYLRRELAKKLKVAPEQLIFGNGSDDIILMALRVFVGPGDEVLVARPSFLMYEISALSLGASPVSVPLKDFQYDLDGMRRRITSRTKIIFIGNPDNPAGTYIPGKKLRAFVEAVPRDILVFIDEAYYEFAVVNKDYPNTLAWIKEFPNIIITRTFSKMYGLAGLRIGYGVAQAEVVDLLNRVREPFNVNSLAQAAALVCLKDPAYYRRIGRELERERKKLYTAFAKMDLSFVPSATNFILIDVRRNGTEVSRALMRQGVIVRDMSAWGLERFIRVTIGSVKENQKLIKALRNVF